MKKSVTHRVSASATIIALQIPFISRKTGRIRIAPIWNTSVLINEITAEITPLFKAVKKLEPKILKPLIKYASE